MGRKSHAYPTLSKKSLPAVFEMSQTVTRIATVEVLCWAREAKVTLLRHRCTIAEDRRDMIGHVGRQNK